MLIHSLGWDDITSIQILLLGFNFEVYIIPLTKARHAIRIALWSECTFSDVQSHWHVSMPLKWYLQQTFGLIRQQQWKELQFQSNLLSYHNNLFRLVSSVTWSVGFFWLLSEKNMYWSLKYRSESTALWQNHNKQGCNPDRLLKTLPIKTLVLPYNSFVSVPN